MSGMILERATAQGLTDQLDEAKRVLKRLQGETSRYQDLMSEAQQAEGSLQKAFKEGTGKFSDLTEAKNATATARELLEQHQADMASAQAEISRLEAEIDGEKKERAWTAMQQEGEAIKAEWNERLTKLTCEYLEGLQGLEPLAERRRKYFEQMPVTARGAGVPDHQHNFHLFELTLASLRQLEAFQPTGHGGGLTLRVGEGPRPLFRVAVETRG